MNYQPHAERYSRMQYRRCGESGVLLPAISLGLWHNFGHVDDFENCKRILFTAFDNGITHFDWPITMGLRPALRKKILVRSFIKILLVISAMN